jgi:hypothetical protein
MSQWGETGQEKIWSALLATPLVARMALPDMGVVPSLRPINYLTIPAVASFPPEDDRVESLA